MNFWEQLRDWLFPLQRDRRTIANVRKKMSERPQLDSEAFAKAYFPEDKQAVARKLWEIAKEHSVADITGMQPDDTFNGDLKMDELDSLSLVEFTIHIEEDFGVNISEEKAKSINSFSDLVNEVCRLKRVE